MDPVAPETSNKLVPYTPPPRGLVLRWRLRVLLHRLEVPLALLGIPALGWVLIFLLAGMLP